MSTVRRRGPWQRAALATGFAAVLTSASFVWSHTASPVISQTQLTTALQSGLSKETLPSNLAPSLSALSKNPLSLAGAWSTLRAQCDPYVHLSEAAHPVPCWYGVTSTTAPVMVIFGDSFVGNWEPALNQVAKHTGYRVAEFEFLGCSTDFVTSAPSGGWTQSQASACNTWHQRLPAAIQRLHPKILLAASGDPSWSTTSDQQWVAGIKLAFQRINPTGSMLQILIGTGVHLPHSGPACLSSNSSHIQSCTFQVGTAPGSQRAIARDVTAAKSTPHLNLIPTEKWVCYQGSCPLVVSGLDVYVDTDHLTIDYSVYLWHLLQYAIKGIVAHPA